MSASSTSTALPAGHGTRATRSVFGFCSVPTKVVVTELPQFPPPCGLPYIMCVFSSLSSCFVVSHPLCSAPFFTPHTHMHQKEVCGICQSAFEGVAPGVKYPGDECPVVWGKCGHSFHLQCVSTWLASRSTCPICRADWEFGAERGAGEEEDEDSGGGEGRTDNERAAEL